MSQLLPQIQHLIRSGKVVSSAHAKTEMQNDEIQIQELLDGVQSAEMIEEYPAYAKGPCVLVLQHDSAGRLVHALWGIRLGSTEPAVLVTVYRPDPALWSDDFKQRRV